MGEAIMIALGERLRVNPIAGVTNVENERFISREREELERLLNIFILRGDYSMVRKLQNALRSGNMMEIRRIIQLAYRALNRPQRKSVPQIRFRRHHGGKSRIRLQDRSSDPNVSMKYPIYVDADFTFPFIVAHEGEHARKIIREAVLKGKLAYVFVRYFVSYDSQGRLYFSGGVTWGKIFDHLA
ncbi:MAG: hypothetical protein J7L52_07545 [Thermotogae bacterium]|nr:hypothetical protein [Thermotogota bacterium]